MKNAPEREHFCGIGSIIPHEYNEKALSNDSATFAFHA